MAEQLNFHEDFRQLMEDVRYQEMVMAEHKNPPKPEDMTPRQKFLAAIDRIYS